MPLLHPPVELQPAAPSPYPDLAATRAPFCVTAPNFGISNVRHWIARGLKRTLSREHLSPIRVGREPNWPAFTASRTVRMTRQPVRRPSAHLGVRMHSRTLSILCYKAVVVGRADGDPRSTKSLRSRSRHGSDRRSAFAGGPRKRREAAEARRRRQANPSPAPADAPSPPRR